MHFATKITLCTKATSSLTLCRFPAQDAGAERVSKGSRCTGSVDFASQLFLELTLMTSNLLSFPVLLNMAVANNGVNRGWFCYSP